MVKKDVIYSTVEMLITGDDPAKPDIRRKSPFIHTHLHSTLPLILIDRGIQSCDGDVALEEEAECCT